MEDERNTGEVKARERNTDDVRQAAILEAAWRVMCQYGYRRTSMEDIARAAGMSRPALYQHFRNKEDIGRRLIEAFYTRAAEDVDRALFGQGAVPDLLAAAFAAKSGDWARPLLDSPHGAEIIDMKTTLAEDVVAQGLARLEGVVAAWLAREEASGRVRLDLPAQDEARLLLAALHGIHAPPFEAFEVARDRLARLLGRGLSPE